MTTEELRKNVIQWAYDKGLDNPIKQSFKTLAEAGELADAMCKADWEEIELTPNMAEIIDAIGDIEFCLTVLKNQLGLNQDLPLILAYNIVKKRTGKTVNGTFIKNE